MKKLNKRECNKAMVSSSVVGTLTYFAQRPIKGALSNRVGPDQTTQNVASDQDLHYLH